MSGSPNSGAWTDHVAEFEALMAKHGVACPEGIQADGKLHRYKAPGDDERDGWYVLHLDGIAAGVFGHWAKRPGGIKWRAAGSKPLDQDQAAKFKVQIAEAKAKRDAEIKAAQAAAARSAKEEQLASKNADADHPYLARKGILAHGAKETADGRLVISVSGEEKIVSLQYIAEDGSKRFLTGGAVKGGSYRLGGKPTDIAYVAEGFATAATIREATDATVYAAFSCHNLPLVAQALHKKYPELKIVVVADNDCETFEPIENPGVHYARQAAGLADGTFIIPKLAGKPDKRCDFNDVHVDEGLDAVRNLLFATQDGLVLRSLGSVQAEPVTWLWEPKVAIGKVALLAGDPGLGKSFVGLYVAARLSIGAAWADGRVNGVGVGETVLLSLEDDPADTIRPRFDALGGDASKTHLLEAVRHTVKRRTMERMFDLASDLPLLEQTIQRNPKVKLIIIDPISAYLGKGGIDSHKNSDMRALLTPLAVLASKYRVAVLAVSHLNKSSNQPVYRVTGSLAFVAAARTVWVIAKDPANPARRLLLPIKVNVGADNGGGLAYSIVLDEQGRPTIAWEKEPVAHSVAEVLGDGNTPKRLSPKTSEAVEFLRAALAEGPRLSTEVEAEALTAGISEKTYFRARGELGVKWEKQRGLLGKNLMVLPDGTKKNGDNDAD